jgi:hypothetical protein
MDFENLLQLAMENWIYTIIGLVVIGFIISRLVKSARIYLGSKSYVRKARKLDRKKYNGLQLIDKTRNKRKRDTNSFDKLRGRSKKRVRKYFSHKVEELPVFTKYSYGKLLKRSKDTLLIVIKTERKTLRKMSMKKGVKKLIESSNKYECLDELINFLHNLPEAILDQQEYDIYVGEQDLLITYQVK